MLLERGLWRVLLHGFRLLFHLENVNVRRDVGAFGGGRRCGFLRIDDGLVGGQVEVGRWLRDRWRGFGLRFLYLLDARRLGHAHNVLRSELNGGLGLYGLGHQRFDRRTKFGVVLEHAVVLAKSHAAVVRGDLRLGNNFLRKRRGRGRLRARHLRHRLVNNFFLGTGVAFGLALDILVGGDWLGQFAGDRGLGLNDIVGHV